MYLTIAIALFRLAVLKVRCALRKKKTPFLFILKYNSFLVMTVAVVFCGMVLRTSLD